MVMMIVYRDWYYEIINNRKKKEWAHQFGADRVYRSILKLRSVYNVHTHSCSFFNSVIFPLSFLCDIFGSKYCVKANIPDKFLSLLLQ